MATKKKVVKKHQRSIEQLSHFRCGKCNKWWSVGDAPLSKKVWHCPWCGLEART
jgi:transcription elongation factor Elf1